MTRHALLIAAMALLTPLSALAHPGHVHAEEWGLVIGLLVAAAVWMTGAATRFVRRRFTAGARRSRI